MYLHQLISGVFDIAYLALIIRVLMSWIPHDRYHPVVSMLYQCTDPMLKPFQNLVPSHKVGLDLSPIFAFIMLGILKEIILRLL